MTITTKWLGTPFTFFQSGTPLPAPTTNIGAADDMQARLVSQIPKGWTAILAPNRDIVLGGIADALAWAYSLLQYVKAQTRLMTTTDFMLDLWGYDFLGTRIVRRKSQNDASFRTTIQKEIFRERNTRRGILTAVTDLTGGAASAFEPGNAQDSGGWSSRTDLRTLNFAFNQAGAWGSRNRDYLMYIWVGEPAGAGTPLISGWADIPSAYGRHVGRFAFVSRSRTTGAVTNQNIYDTINGTRAAGVTCWVKIGGMAPWATTPAIVAAQASKPQPPSININLLLLGP